MIARRRVLTVIVALGACGPIDGGLDAGSVDAGPSCSSAPGAVFTPTLSVRRDGGPASQPIFTSDRLDFRVEGLPPCADVELVFSLDGGHASRARFTASPEGTVSTEGDAPTSGTWSGIDPDGPFWSLRGGTPASPVSHDTLVLARWDGGSSSALVPRTVLPPGTTLTEYRETTTHGLYGTFYRPPGAGPFPGVVVFGGSEGGLGGGAFSGLGLVREGFAVLAIAYFAVPGKPSGMTRIPLEVFRDAVRRLRTFPDVSPGKIAVFGVSRGGEASLLAGQAFSDDVQAVVSLVGGGYAWAAPGSSTVSTWTLDGGDIPFVPWPTGSDVTVVRDAGYSVTFSAPFFAQGLDDAAAAGLLERAETPVERTRGPVLLWSSGDDGIWPSCRQSQVAWARLVDAGHVALWGDTATCFAGTGHAINPSRAGFPLVDLIESGTGAERTGLGGSAKADNDANHVILHQTSQFLHDALR